jgi:hypothetical protein
MQFETNITVSEKDGSRMEATGKEKQRPKYTRDGNKQIISTNIDSLFIKEVVTDAAKGRADVNVQLRTKATIQPGGIYLGLSVPAEFYANGTVAVNNLKPVRLAPDSVTLNKYLHTPASSVHFV